MCRGFYNNLIDSLFCKAHSQCVQADLAKTSRSTPPRSSREISDLKIALVYSVTDTMHIYTHRAIYKNLLIFMWRSAEKESERRSESGRRERERAPKAAQEMASVKVKERKLETSLHRIEWN